MAQSDFGYPCIPWEDAGVNRGPGFWSGPEITNVYSTDVSGTSPSTPPPPDGQTRLAVAASPQC